MVSSQLDALPSSAYEGDLNMSCPAPYDAFEPEQGNAAPEEQLEAGSIEETEARAVLPLGHDKGVYFYYSRATRQTAALSPDKHSKNALLALASMDYWASLGHLHPKTNAILWDDVIDELMNNCRNAGIFEPERIRGRGAWMDDGRALMHLGDRITHGGRFYGLEFPGSRYVYEAARSLSIDPREPISLIKSRRLLELCGMLRWERPVYGKLLAGWLALAPICGVLAWRPSIWITGGPGSGKSYIRENIMAHCLGDIALAVQSKTSEAGIRQKLNSDARPVLFDEAEREDAASAQRMQSVLDLVRQSSSEGGAEIVKGTAAQTGAKSYRIRSMFAFQSINIALQHSADESRVTVLSLRPPTKNDPESQAQFAALEELVSDLLTSDFAAGLISRSVAMAPVIRHNAEVFARAIAENRGTRRLGDQVGTLMAGAYALAANGYVTPEQAQEFVGRDDWRETMEVEESAGDEWQLWNFLMSHRMRLNNGEFTVAEVIHGALSTEQLEGYPSSRLAHQKLGTIGLKIEDGALLVATKHAELKKILSGTNWGANWSNALRKLPGASSPRKNSKFAGFLSRTTSIPLTIFDEE